MPADHDRRLSHRGRRPRRAAPDGGSVETLAGIAHDALYRQYASGGPVVSVSPFYRRGSRNTQTTVQLAVAFRAVNDGHLHVLAEAGVRGLDSFTMSFDPSRPSPYAERGLQYYHRPVPGLAVADLGRSAGYTLRPEGFAVAFCITEEVMDELFGPPFIGSPERERGEAALRERSRLQPGAR